MIQIIGYREHKYPDGKIDLATYFLNKNWRAPSLTDLYNNIEKYITDIPVDERWNIHYTVARCHEKKGRVMQEQWAIPFDIDGIDTSRLEEYISITLAVLMLQKEQVNTICSGNGLHFVIVMKKPFTEQSYFARNKKYYKVICDRIESLLQDMGLEGNLDTNVFRHTATLRMPGTSNVKKNKSTTQCYIINKSQESVDFSLSHLAGKYQQTFEEVEREVIKSYPEPDTDEVLTCPFLKWAKDFQDEVKEPQWYAMLSIVSRLKDGMSLVHDFSKDYHDYSEEETNNKAEKALESAGPRTCYNISTLWNGCQECTHYKNPEVVSPINLKGELYIKTKEHGFYNVKRVMNEKTGESYLKKTKPNFSDLRKYFEQLYPYRTLEDSKCVYTYKDMHWNMVYDATLENFAQENLNPAPNTSQCSEFKNLIQRTCIAPSDWFNPVGLINFRNGVLNMDTLEFMSHSMDYGFTYVLDHDYNSEATCPMFDKFMEDVTVNREDLINLLLEYAGYCVSNMKCIHDKAMILLGDGSNGKSTFMSVLKMLVGTNNYSALTMTDLSKETSRYLIYNKLFNIAEETPKKSFLDSSVFKNLVSGGDTVVKMLYKQPFTVKNRCKLFMAANEMPPASDVTHGMFRRMLIVPFDATFEGNAKDIFMEEKLEEELPGIFNRIIVAYKRLLKRGRFTHSTSVEKEISEYRAQTDSIRQWYRDRVNISDNEDDFAYLVDLFRDYGDYADDRSMYKQSYASFCKRLRILTKDKCTTIRRNQGTGYNKMKFKEDY